MDFSLLGEPHDQGLVFKWGSLVGIELPTSGADGSSPFTVADTVFVPNEFTGTITNDWATVPYCATDFAPYNNTATDHLAAIHDPTRGIGDICRYMGGGWRIPTAAEIAELYGSDQVNGGRAVVLGGGWVTGNYYPLSGRAFGPHQTRVAITSNTQVDNADPYINGAVFLPACGNRHITIGAIYNIGSGGWFWSSTAQSAVNGYDMGFHSSGVVPQESWSRAYGFSVRCIRE